MDKAESITTVDDAIKKLALLDSKDKIWTQEMLLQVSDKAVRLLDCDTQVRLNLLSTPCFFMTWSRLCELLTLNKEPSAVFHLIVQKTLPSDLLTGKWLDGQ